MSVTGLGGNSVGVLRKQDVMKDTENTEIRTQTNGIAFGGGIQRSEWFAVLRVEQNGIIRRCRWASVKVIHRLDKSLNSYPHIGIPWLPRQIASCVSHSFVSGFTLDNYTGERSAFLPRVFHVTGAVGSFQKIS